MNGFLLMLPLFLIRFGLLGLIGGDGLRRAAHFAPLVGRERTAYLFYQISNVFLILYPAFLTVRSDGPLFWTALAVYAAGVAVLAVSTVHFARPGPSGINMDGIYRISRNPMYVGYFLYFLGCVLLMRSVPLLLALVVFQISAHWIVLSEERWCIQRFGEEYIGYMERVRRYL